MGLVILLLVIILGVASATYAGTRNEDRKLSEVRDVVATVTIIAMIFMSSIWGTSYAKYIRLEQALAVIEQYKESITLYSEKGITEFRHGTTELTDLKYNYYQQQIGQMIRDMRDRIIGYNETLAGKSAMASNWFWSWCIILPEDMKPIKMSDYLK